MIEGQRGKSSDGRHITVVEMQKAKTGGLTQRSDAGIELKLLE